MNVTRHLEIPLKRVLVTGYGPFLDVIDNPSAKLAENTGAPFRILDVEFAAVEAFLEDLDPKSFDALFMIGVARSTRMRFESVAKNKTGPTPDTEERVFGPGTINPAGPPQMAATLWPAFDAIDTSELGEASVDAGDYLCNYLLYRALQQFPDKLVGFLHVPEFGVIPFETQLAEVKRLISLITETA